MTSSVEVKNNCCDDDVSSTFVAVMRCSFFIYLFVYFLPCCSVQAPSSPISPFMTVATELVLLNWQV